MFHNHLAYSCKKSSLQLELQPHLFFVQQQPLPILKQKIIVTAYTNNSISISYKKINKAAVYIVNTIRRAYFFSIYCDVFICIRSLLSNESMTSIIVKNNSTTVRNQNKRDLLKPVRNRVSPVKLLCWIYNWISFSTLCSI